MKRIGKLAASFKTKKMLGVRIGHGRSMGKARVALAALLKWDPRSQNVARADLEKPGDRPKDLSPLRPT